MGRRTPHSGLNRNNPFYEKGKLKAGYSYQGGPGMVAKGTGSYSVRYGAGKDGTSYKVEQRTIYGKAPAAPAPRPAPAPAPAPAPRPAPPPVAPPVAPPTGISEKLQAAQNFEKKDSNYDFRKSGSNFKNNTQAERKELTDSYKQYPSYERKQLTDSFKRTPAYDPQAGISSPEAGNFLDDYRLNLQGKINKFRAEAT